MHCTHVHKTKVTRPRPRRLYLQDRDETETFDFSKLSRPRRSTFKTETRRSKKTPRDRDVQDRDYIPGRMTSTFAALNTGAFSKFYLTSRISVFVSDIISISNCDYLGPVCSLYNMASPWLLQTEWLVLGL